MLCTRIPLLLCDLWYIKLWVQALIERYAEVNLSEKTFELLGKKHSGAASIELAQFSPRGNVGIYNAASDKFILHPIRKDYSQAFQTVKRVWLFLAEVVNAKNAASVLTDAR